MGTNYYRIPKEIEFERIRNMMLYAIKHASPFNLASGYDSILEEIVNHNWKDEEGNDIIVHLGKRSCGWQFLWNFHRDRFYKNKKELLAFIRAGRVFNEYGEELDPEEFIQMALNWCPDGWNSETNPDKTIFDRNWHDRFVDGLRVSQDQEYSTYFC